MGTDSAISKVFFPVFQRPLEEFFQRILNSIFLLDEEFVSVSHFCIGESVLLKLIWSCKYSLFQVKL